MTWARGAERDETDPEIVESCGDKSDGFPAAGFLRPLGDLPSVTMDLAAASVSKLPATQSGLQDDVVNANERDVACPNVVDTRSPTVIW